MKDKVLIEAANWFEMGANPLTETFVQENDVEFDELMQISSMIGMLIKAYVRSPKWVQTIMMAVGVMPEELPVDTDGIWYQGIHQEMHKRLRVRK